MGKGQILRTRGPRHGRCWGSECRFLWSSDFSKGLSHATNSPSFPKLCSLVSVNCWILGYSPASQATPPWHLLFFPPLLRACASLFCPLTLGDLMSLHLSVHHPPISNSINDLFPESLELIYFCYVSKYIWSANCVPGTVLNTL